MMNRIDLPYACGGVEVDSSGMVVDAAPIFRWMIGKPWETFCRAWVARKGGTFMTLPKQ